MNKWLAVAAYRCEVAGSPHDVIDVQVKYFEFKLESEIEPALAEAKNHAYLNSNGEKVEWIFTRLLLVARYKEPEHGHELVGCHVNATEIQTLAKPPILTL